MSHERADTPVTPWAAAGASAPCPLNRGLAVVDQLLAEITRRHAVRELDAALDFRCALVDATDPHELLLEFFRLRVVVEERHYLECYRLRRWLESRFVASVRCDRAQPPVEVPIRLDGRGLRQSLDRCAVTAARGAAVPAWAVVRVVPVTPRETPPLRRAAAL